MDPNLSDSSLQKTSPNSDPAALMQLSAELSAQASQLTLHQHQLNRLTTLTEELVKALQGLSVLPPETASPSPPARSSPPPAQVPSINPRLAFQRNSMEKPPSARASYYNARFLLTSNPHYTPQTQAALPLFVHYSPGRH